MISEDGFDVTINTVAKFDVYAQNEAGAIAFSSGDALECTVWQGEDSASIFNPTVAWVSAPAGHLLLTFPAALTASIARGPYPIEITATASGLRIPILRSWVQLNASPGSGTLDPTYSSYQDLLDYGGGDWLSTAQQSEGFSNFAAERAKGRSYLDQLILRKFRPWGSRGLDSGIAYTGGAMNALNPTLADYLSSNFLIVTDVTKEICSLKALELICRRRITWDEKNIYLNRAVYFKQLCSKKVLMYTAEIDINADGLAEYAIRLNTISIR
jgi:hypothetical protein